MDLYIYIYIYIYIYMDTFQAHSVDSELKINQQTFETLLIHFHLLQS